MVLIVALAVGVMRPEPQVEPVLKPVPRSAGEERAQRAKSQAKVAQLDRQLSAVKAALKQNLLDSLHPSPRPEPLNATAAMSALGAALPLENAFAGADEGLWAADAGADLPPPPPVQFLGESLVANRIVLAIDVSASVRTKLGRAGLSMEEVRSEVAALIDQLGPDHLFGLILFTRNSLCFREELLPATRLIKEQALEWLNREFRTDGTSARHWQSGVPNGIEAVLASAFAMDPRLNEIFILSDGDFYRTPPGGGGQKVPLPQLRERTAALQRNNAGKARLRLMAFYPPEHNLPQLREWTRENANGTLRIVDNKNQVNR